MKTILSIIMLAIVVLASLLLINTLRFTTDPVADSTTGVNISLDEAGAVRRFSRALTFPTISHQDPANTDVKAFKALRAYLVKNFPEVFKRLDVETVSGLSYLIKWQGSDSRMKPIALLAHMDVVPVPPGTESDWNYPPFGGTVADGFIWGRGAIDNKSGVLGLLEAAETLLKQGFLPARTIYLAFGHDEEIGGTKGAVQIAELLASRNIELEFVLDEGGLIATEGVFGIKKPVASIGTSEKGYLSLKLSALGTGGHSSRPPEYTAVGLVARAVDRLQQNPFPLNFDRTAEFIRGLGGDVPFAQRMMFANPWFFEVMAKQLLPADPPFLAGMRTTTAPTMFRAGIKDNVLPSYAEATVNFRIYSGESSKTVIAQVVKIIDDEQVKVERAGFFSDPSKISDTDSFGYRQLLKSIRQIVTDKNLIITPRLGIGATDSRHYSTVTSNIYRFIGLGVTPVELAGFHGTNERIATQSYVTAVKIYIQMIKNSSSGGHQ